MIFFLKHKNIMDLLPRDFLQFIDESIYPKPKSFSNGQIWYDTISDRHGVVVGNTLYWFVGVFTTICQQDLTTGQYLYQPTVQDFLRVTPNARIEMWESEFSVRIEDDENPRRFSSLNPLEACASAYLSLFINTSHEWE